MYRQLCIERLEGRDVPAVGSAFLSPSGILSVIGTTGNDHVVVERTSETVHVRFRDGFVGTHENWVTHNFALNQTREIRFWGYAGNDSFTNRTWVPSVASGGAGNDNLTGGTSADVLNGDGGNDHLYGGYGNDQLKGGRGDDRLHGEGNDDGLNGGDGYDFLSGGRGNDWLFGGHDYESDSFAGGAGADHFELLLPRSGGVTLIELIRDFNPAEGDTKIEWYLET